MGEELKAVLAQEIKKYLLIGAGIILGCMLIGVAVITAIAGGEDPMFLARRIVICAD